MGHGVDAQRKRNVGAVLRSGADQRPGALEGHDVGRHVLGRARIEQRPAGGAARAPVLDHLGARRDAELLVEPLRGNLAQRILRQHRDLAPFLRVIQPREIDRRHAPLPERRLQRPLDRDALALALDPRDVGRRARPPEIHHRLLIRDRPRLFLMHEIKTWSVPDFDSFIVRSPAAGGARRGSRGCRAA